MAENLPSVSSPLMVNGYTSEGANSDKKVFASLLKGKGFLKSWVGLFFHEEQFTIRRLSYQKKTFIQQKNSVPIC